MGKLMPYLGDSLGAFGEHNAHLVRQASNVSYRLRADRKLNRRKLPESGPQTAALASSNEHLPFAYEDRHDEGHCFGFLVSGGLTDRVELWIAGHAGQDDGHAPGGVRQGPGIREET